MNGYTLKSGEIIHPQRAEAPGVIGDGWAIAAPGSEAFASWKAWSARPASPELETLAERLRAGGGQAPGR